MSEWRVELEGSSREVYIVQADSAKDAAEHWTSGYLWVQESFGMGVVSVAPEEDDA
jgi:hypothetical protein